MTLSVDSIFTHKIIYASQNKVIAGRHYTLLETFRVSRPPRRTSIRSLLRALINILENRSTMLIRLPRDLRTSLIISSAPQQ